VHTDKRTAIVTGAYGAIGQAICEGIAGKGFELTMVGRDRSRLQKTQSFLVQRTGNQHIFYEVVDLSSQSEISGFSRRWKKPLNLLVNNAATAPLKRTETRDGIEMQWAANVLGYFWMISYFHAFMEGCNHPRIVNVASYWAGGMDLTDPEFRKRPYDNDIAYRQAKQANRMLTVAFSERLNGKGITVNACHPGDVNSKLSNAFGFGGSESPEEGAATPLFLSLSDQVRDVTGKYFEHLVQVKCPFVQDKPMVERLFSLCSQTIPGNG
jgi:NAD(P)-dependent dehydrogenase (short-subunit alcohol dehydrogenase family)